jgi:Fe-S-cluster containining protein
MERYPRVDLRALALALGDDLDPALEQLQQLYEAIDARNGANTADLDLPCHRGCDACCHESVFLTPLEFFAAWDHVQQHADDAARERIVQRGLELYAEHRGLIDALGEAPPAGEADHLSIARRLRFTCPLLGADGACSIYASRELYARMFGCSFNDEGGVYGCDLVGAHLGGRTVTLMRVRPAAQMLGELPLTWMRQVYPYYIQVLYGA